MTEQTDNPVAVVAAEQAVTDALRGMSDLAGWRLGVRESGAATRVLGAALGYPEPETKAASAVWDALDALAAVVQNEKESTNG